MPQMLACKLYLELPPDGHVLLTLFLGPQLAASADNHWWLHLAGAVTSAPE